MKELSEQEKMLKTYYKKNHKILSIRAIERLLGWSTTSLDKWIKYDSPMSQHRVDVLFDWTIKNLTTFE